MNIDEVANKIDIIINCNNGNLPKETVKVILKDQCEEIKDIIFKYQNQWEQTSGHLYKSEESEPTARLIRLLFSLIQSDINDIVKSYEDKE